MDNLAEQVIPEQVLSPEEMEKKVLDEQTKKAEENAKRSPEDVAAAMFTYYFPIFKNALWNKKFNKKKIIKVFLAAVETPLNQKEYKLMTKDEQELCSIAMGLMEAKWQMMLATLIKVQQQQDEAKKAKDTLEEANSQANTEVPDLKKQETSVNEKELNNV